MKYIVLILMFISTNVYAQKVTALTEDTSPTVDDLTITVDNPSGTPVTKKATIANIFKSHNLYTNSGANVGIGTTIPTVEAAYRGLEIKAPTNAGATISLDTTDADRNPQIEFVENNVQKWKVFNENASDSLRFRTGATDVLTLTSGGNVGIGTTTPQGGLVVTNGNVGIGTWVPSAAGLTVRNGASNAGIWSLYGIIISTSGQTFRATNNNYYMPYGTSSGSFNAQSEIASAKGIFFNIDTDNNDTDTSDVDTRFVFGHNGLTNASTALMAITEKGNVGIGTINPEGSLIVANGNVGIGTWTPEASLNVTGGDILLDNNKFIKAKDSSGTIQSIVQYSSSNNLLLYPGANNDVYVNSSTTLIAKGTTGNVGMGTSNPSGKLGIRSASTSAVPLIVYAFPSATANSFEVRDSTGLQKVVIDANNNVGIGSLAPGSALDLGTSGNIKIPVQKATTGTRYLCIDTAGNVSSSASACSGT